jgi:HK97 family phage prohead protease
MHTRTADDLAGGRAFSILDVKSITEREDAWVVKGIASTPTVDRMGDIVEPLGARFMPPMPLLWQHQSDKPVGRMVAAKPTKKGIPFEAEIPKVSEPGTLKDRIDEAVHSLKYRLVAAVSIGFKAVRDQVEVLADGGLRFKEWEWLELSLVTIPANPDATITSFKSFDDDLRAALRAKRVGVVRLNSPGASGTTPIIHRKAVMKTYKEQIAALEATRAAKAARLGEIQKKVAEESRTKDAAEREEFDTLGGEIKQIDVELKDLRDLEALNVAAADPVADPVTQKAAPAAFAGARVSINAKLEPGIKFARMALCVARAKHLQKEGHFMAPADIYRAEKSWMDSAPDVHLALKGAINANDSTTAAGASEWAYAQNIASEFIEYLRPLTLIGRIQGAARAQIQEADIQPFAGNGGAVAAAAPAEEVPA